jgi:hypothetical protein
MAQCQDASLAYANDSWDRLTKAFTCSSALARMVAFACTARNKNLQVKLTRSLPCGGDFVLYIDAIGETFQLRISSTNSLTCSAIDGADVSPGDSIPISWTTHGNCGSR